LPRVFNRRRPHRFSFRGERIRQSGLSSLIWFSAMILRLGRRRFFSGPNPVLVLQFLFVNSGQVMAPFVSFGSPELSSLVFCHQGPRSHEWQP
jgi:hypothetical protein